MSPYILALLAALSFALGSVLQQKGTLETDAAEGDPRFLKEILRKQAASNPLQTILEETESLASHPFAGASSSQSDARTRDASVARAQLPAQAESASAPVQPLREPATQPGVGPGPAPHT